MRAPRARLLARAWELRPLRGTTKVLTEAAINRKTDTLRGLREKSSCLIPPGTGLAAYKSFNLVVE